MQVKAVPLMSRLFRQDRTYVGFCWSSLREHDRCSANSFTFVRRCGASCTSPSPLCGTLEIDFVFLFPFDRHSAASVQICQNDHLGHEAESSASAASRAHCYDFFSNLFFLRPCIWLQRALHCCEFPSDCYDIGSS